MKIRYFTVARDEFEAGSCPTCARCGATMRHVTEINGATYGTGCGKIVLASLEAAESEIKRLVAEAAKVLPAAAARFNRGEFTADEIQTRQLRCYDAGKMDWSMAWGHLYAAICKQKITPTFRTRR